MADSSGMRITYCRMDHQHHDFQSAMAMRVQTCALQDCRRREAHDRRAFYAGIPNGEDILAEIGVLKTFSSSSDRCPFIVNLIDLARDDAHTVVLTEPWDSDDIMSSLDEAHSPGMSVRTCMWQLLQAVQYLHSKNISHRNICLENLRAKDGQLRLMGFGQAVQLSSSAGPLRYFRCCGSRYYRAPECHVPATPSFAALCPEDYQDGSVVSMEQGGFCVDVCFAEGAKPSELSPCEPCGFEAAPVDVFACGVVFVVLQGRRSPWTSALPSDPRFVAFRQFGVDALGLDDSVAPSGEQLLADLLCPMPSCRTSVERALGSTWFDDLK